MMRTTIFNLSKAVRLSTMHRIYERKKKEENLSSSASPLGACFSSAKERAMTAKLF